MLSIQHITKRFGPVIAIDDVSFEVSEGRIFGLLGPNGAGKTTLIRMMTNIIIPDAGNMLLDGLAVGSIQQNDIGYLPEERGLYKKLKVADQITYFGKLKGLSGRDALQRGMQWLQKLNATDFAGKKVQELSKGMQQKVQFVCTVLHSPKLIILDEPFSGLDPVNAGLLIDVVKGLQQQGTTIILSTHQMSQVEQLCEDIVLIDKGHVVLQGAVRDVKSRYRKDRIFFEYDDAAPILTDIPGVAVVDEGPFRAELQLGPNVSAETVLKILVDRTSITRFEVAVPSLHDIFVETVTHAS